MSDWTLRFQVNRFRNLEAEGLEWLLPSTKTSYLPTWCLLLHTTQLPESKKTSGCLRLQSWRDGPLFPSLRQILKPSKQMAMLILLLDIYFVAKLENSQENGKVTFFPLHKFVNGWHNAEACLLELCETPTNCLCRAL